MTSEQISGNKMRPWERRLKDLARLLENCESTYFDPDLFRMNTNQFLQTARTVTFIIQKSKAEIPEFDSWYQANVIDPWGSDARMKWAKDSRNTIEKVGDLELHSSSSATLIIGYLQETDIHVDVRRKELIGANIKRLIRFAEKKLPSGVSRGAVVRIERKWVANTLPEWELLTALVYVYSRAKEVCQNLARHLDSALPPEIPDPTEFDAAWSDARGIRYVTLQGRAAGQMRSQRIQSDPNFELPPKLVALVEKRKGSCPPKSFNQLVDYHVEMATVNFETYGSHVPMLFMYGADGDLVDYISTEFYDRSDKYLFWRSVADRVLYVKPKAIVWIAEAWIRSRPKARHQRIDNLPITGEMLHLFAITDNGNVQAYRWEIERHSDSNEPALGEPEKVASKEESMPTFFAPIKRSFEKLAAK